MNNVSKNVFKRSMVVGSVCFEGLNLTFLLTGNEVYGECLSIEIVKHRKLILTI